MQLHRKGSIALTLLATVALAAGCGDNGATDRGTGPSTAIDASVPDHAGVNTPITAANAEQVMLELSTDLNQAFTRMMQAAASAKDGGAGAAAKSIAGLQIRGLMSGTLTVPTGELQVGQEAQSLTAQFVFDDFSDDGEIYIGGTIEIDFTSTVDAMTGEPRVSLTETGALAFSGKFKGAVGLHLSVEIGGSGSPSISGTVTIDGQTVSLDALTSR